MSKNPDQPLLRGITQVCFVVDDFDATLATLTTQLGIGPFKCWHYHEPKLFHTHLHGQPVPWSMKLAVAWVGAMQVIVRICAKLDQS